MNKLKSILLALLVLSSTAFSKIPLKDFLKSSEFNVVSISPDGKKLAGILEDSPGTDKIAVIDLASMKGLSAFEFGENRKINNLNWVNNETIALNIEKREGYLDRKGKWEALYIMKANGKKKFALRQRGKTASSVGRAGAKKSKQGFATIVDGLIDEPKLILARVAHGNVYYLAKINIKSGKEYPLSRPADKKLQNVWVNNNNDPVIAVSGYDRVSNSSNFYYNPNPDIEFKILTKFIIS